MAAETEENVVSRALDAVEGVVSSYVEDYTSGIEDGTYEDAEGLARAEAAQESLRAMAPALARTYAAGRALIDALGGMPIDWLKTELVALEEALAEVERSPSPEPKAPLAPAP